MISSNLLLKSFALSRSLAAAVSCVKHCSISARRSSAYARVRDSSSGLLVQHIHFNNYYLDVWHQLFSSPLIKSRALELLYHTFLLFLLSNLVVFLFVELMLQFLLRLRLPCRTIIGDIDLCFGHFLPISSLVQQ